MSFREALSAAPRERAIDPIDTPFGRTFVRSLTVGEKDDWDTASQAGTKHPRVHLAIACCCKEDGSPEFTEFDAGMLRDLPSHYLEPVIEAAMKVNKFGKQEQEALRKN